MRRVVYSDDALADLDELYFWIAERANQAVASNYTGRIRDYCARLYMFPLRGRLRTEIRPDLRIIGWRRRAIIAFTVESDRVVILRILRRGRSLEKAFGVDVPD